jgi:general secretion pathway protein H
MRTSAAGSERRLTDRRACLTRLRGFTLVELMVVVAIIAIATAGVALSLRDASQNQLEREAQRLAALLESARAQSRTRGVVVTWVATSSGFAFQGLPAGTLPSAWLADTTFVPRASTLTLGPDPILAAQSVVVRSASDPQTGWVVATDGLHPFTTQPP